MSKKPNIINPRKVERYVGDCKQCHWSTPPMQTSYEATTILKEHRKTQHSGFSIHCKVCEKHINCATLEEGINALYIHTTNCQKPRNR